MGNPKLLLLPILGTVLIVGCNSRKQAPYEPVYTVAQAEQAAQAYKAAGLPWTYAELYPPSTPQQIEGTKLVLEAERVNAKVDLGKLWVECSKLDKEGKFKQGLALSAKAKPVTDLIEQALKHEPLFYRVTPKNIADVAGKSLLFEREIVRWYSMQGSLASKTRDYAKMRSNFDLAIRFANARKSTTGINALVKSATHLIIHREIQLSSAALEHDAEGLHFLRGIVQKLALQEDMAQMLRSEAYWALAMARNPKKYEADAIAAAYQTDKVFRDVIAPDLPARDLAAEQLPFEDGVIPTDPQARDRAVSFMRFFTEVSPIAKASGNDWLSMRQQWKALGETWKKRRPSVHPDLLSGFRTYESICDSLLKAQADQVQTKALIAALEFQFHFGWWPKTITELGATYVDPFTGQAMRIKIKGEAWKIYSVGPDGLDDDGLTPREAGNGKTSDLVLEYPLPFLKRSPGK